jgi:hypothetical protein
MDIKVEAPYIPFLSNNSYKIGKTKVTHPLVILWMGDVSKAVRIERERLDWRPQGKFIVVELDYYFSNNQFPDPHNLHKVIADGIAPGLKLNDKYYLLRDMTVTLWESNEKIVITIKGE